MKSIHLLKDSLILKKEILAVSFILCPKPGRRGDKIDKSRCCTYLVGQVFVDYEAVFVLVRMLRGGGTFTLECPLSVKSFHTILTFYFLILCSNKLCLLLKKKTQKNPQKTTKKECSRLRTWLSVSSAPVTCLAFPLEIPARSLPWILV